MALIDLTLEAWELLLARKLEPRDVNTLERRVSFVVPNGRKWLGDYMPWHADVGEGTGNG